MPQTKSLGNWRARQETEGLGIDRAFLRKPEIGDASVRSAFLKERFRRTGSRIRTLEVCLFLSLACSCAAAFDSDRTIAQFAHTSWGPKDGAPSVVEALSADGYLWLGSPDGLYWAATESGLARLEGNRWKEVGRDWNFPGKSARAIFLDRQGTFWVSTEDTLVSLPSGASRFQPTGIRVGQLFQIARAASGKLWMAETTRSVRPIPLSDKRLPPDETEIQVGSAGILFDNDGALWITSVGRTR